MMKFLVMLSMIFLFSCEDKNTPQTADNQVLPSDEIAQDAAAMEESSADCDDKLLDGASVDSEDLLKANTGCTVDEAGSEPLE